VTTIRREALMRRLITLAFVTLLVAIPLSADAQKKGGVLKIGNLGEPPSLDPHWAPRPSPRC